MQLLFWDVAFFKEKCFKNRLHQTESKQNLQACEFSQLLWEIKWIQFHIYFLQCVCKFKIYTHFMHTDLSAAHPSVKAHRKTAVTNDIESLILEPQSVNNESTLTYCLASLEYCLFVLHSTGTSFNVTSETRQPGNQPSFPSRTTGTTPPLPSRHVSMCSINNR